MTTSTTMGPAEPGPAQSFDYYYRDGMPLRPAPERTRATWLQLRRNLYSRWVSVPQGWTDTPFTRLLDDHMWEGDEAMDDVVQMFERVGPAAGRAIFERALTEGITAIGDPPQELTTLFEQLDRKPDWYDQAADERGRLRLCSATVTAKLAAQSFGVFATAREGDVSAATGATGRIVSDPVRRNVETTKFFEEITYRGALRRESPIFHTIVRVRLMHALVRQGLRRKWGDEVFARHGMPISNTNMAAGSGWFATMTVLVDDMLGRPVKMHELDDIAIHWGYILYLFGVNERIIPKDGLASIVLANHLFANAGEPSKWANELAEALLSPFGSLAGPAGPLFLRLFLAGGATILGAAETQQLVYGTKYENIRVSRWVPVFLVLARTGAFLARVGDNLAIVRARRRRRAQVGDPFELLIGRRVTTWGEKHGIDAAPFTHHDESYTGKSLAT